MKDKLGIVIGVLAFVILCGGAFYLMEYHEEYYYTQIDNTKVERLSSRDDMKYKYTLKCYNEKGWGRDISFKTSRKLREGAYLKLRVILTGVNKWEEVSYDKLPSGVIGKYEKESQ